MHKNNTSAMPISSLLEELGRRIERYRLSRNLRQEDVAKMAGITRVTISKLERGRGNIDSLARVMRSLGVENRLLNIVPDARISPMDPRSVSGNERQRARPLGTGANEEPWTWGN